MCPCRRLYLSSFWDAQLGLLQAVFCRGGSRLWLELGLVLVLIGSGFGWRTENSACHVYLSVPRTENNTEPCVPSSVQKRAIHIIFNFTRGMSYPNVLFVAQLESLETRRNNLSRSFFQDICKPTSCLHYLIPPRRDTSVTTRLRLTTSSPRPNLRTKKYCSLINFGLHHYQPT